MRAIAGRAVSSPARNRKRLSGNMPPPRPGMLMTMPGRASRSLPCPRLCRHAERGVVRLLVVISLDPGSIARSCSCGNASDIVPNAAGSLPEGAVFGD
jgi:hypothetical protein